MTLQGSRPAAMSAGRPTSEGQPCLPPVTSRAAAACGPRAWHSPSARSSWVPAASPPRMVARRRWSHPPRQARSTPSTRRPPTWAPSSRARMARRSTTSPRTPHPAPACARATAPTNWPPFTLDAGRDRRGRRRCHRRGRHLRPVGWLDAGRPMTGVRCTTSPPTRPPATSLARARVASGSWRRGRLRAACTGTSGSPAAARVRPTPSTRSTERPGHLPHGRGRQDALLLRQGHGPGCQRLRRRLPRNWPAFMLESDETVAAGDGVTGVLGTFARSDGTMQVTYDGRPCTTSSVTPPRVTSRARASVMSGTWPRSMAPCRHRRPAPHPSPPAGRRWPAPRLTIATTAAPRSRGGVAVRRDLPADVRFRIIAAMSRTTRALLCLALAIPMSLGASAALAQGPDPDPRPGAHPDRDRGYTGRVRCRYHGRLRVRWHAQRLRRLQQLQRHLEHRLRDADPDRRHRLHPQDVRRHHRRARDPVPGAAPGRGELEPRRHRAPDRVRGRLRPVLRRRRNRSQRVVARLHRVRPHPLPRPVAPLPHRLTSSVPGRRPR